MNRFEDFSEQLKSRLPFGDVKMFTFHRRCFSEDSTEINWLPGDVNEYGKELVVVMYIDNCLLDEPIDAYFEWLAKSLIDARISALLPEIQGEL